jgi:hypothetical protein
MEGKIPMAARRHVANKLRTVYQRASTVYPDHILDKVQAAIGIDRSTVR